MNTAIYLLGIILAVIIIFMLFVGLVATAKAWFELMADYWENSRRYKRIKRKGHLIKLGLAAQALHHWRWAYPETQDMNLVQMRDFYFEKVRKLKSKEK